MTTISPHTTRGTGTILTAAIYNTDHNNHITNASNLNADKLERAGGVTPGNVAVWVDDESLEDGGTLGTMAFEDAADYALADGSTPIVGNLTVQSNDADALEAPILTLYRNSASPTANDLIGLLRFLGRDTAPGDQTYAEILAEILDATSTSEDARLNFRTVVAGTLATRARIGQGLLLGAATGGDQGAGTINATEYYKNGFRAWTTIRKAADQTGSNTTFISDDTLTVPLLASTDYHIRGAIHYDTPTAADFKVQFTGPASPTLVSIGVIACPPGGTFAIDNPSLAAFSEVAQITASTGTAGILTIEALIRNGVNAGNALLQWAQIANSGTTTVRQGSYLEYRQL